MGRLMTRAALGVVLLVTLPSCGGSSKGTDDSGSCENADACGGDVVGVWTISASCLDVDAAQMMESSSCPGVTARASDWNVTGSITFTSELTYSSTTTIGG